MSPVCLSLSKLSGDLSASGGSRYRGPVGSGNRTGAVQKQKVNVVNNVPQIHSVYSVRGTLLVFRLMPLTSNSSACPVAPEDGTGAPRAKRARDNSWTSPSSLLRDNETASVT